MNKLDHFLAAFGLRRADTKATKPAQGKRFFGSSSSRMTVDWLPSYGDADADLRDASQNLIGRSRELERNNDYARRFLAAAENNVLGWSGLSLQNKAVTPRKFMPDNQSNLRIEEGWKLWGKKRTCSWNQEDHWTDIQRLVLRTTLRDGGIFCRKVFDKENPFGFSLELLEYDYLDIAKTGTSKSGNRIFMGVEKNAANRVIAYYLYRQHPGGAIRSGDNRSERVEATNIIHYFIKERVGQSVGIPAFCSAMYRLHFLEKYEQAELAAARNGAEKGGFFQSERGDQYGGEVQTNTDEDGNTTENTLNNFQPGAYDELPPGMTFVPYDPKHPNQAYDDFVRTCLMGISAGLNIDYPTLTNDLSAANYSSMRAGKLEAQETWKAMQGHLIRNFAEEVWDEWLPYTVLKGQVQIPFDSIDRLSKPLFRGRRWPWVDPEKDLKAAKLAIEQGLDTRSNIAAQSGEDFEDNIRIMAEEKRILEEAGITLGEAKEAPKPVETEELEEEDPDEESESDE